MQEIIEAVSRDNLKKELNKQKFLRHTNKANNEIYIITADTSPEVMREIGRLREISFRQAGGGTGKSIDIDHYDTRSQPYKQLIVWNPEDEAIVGGYRFFNCNEVSRVSELPALATAELFHFSEEFKKSYLPFTIELGRSFVQPNYQPSLNSRKGIYSLDNLWDGLGALTVEYPSIKYYFGKITMYPSFNRTARDLILYFLKKHFPDPAKLVYPHEAVEMVTDPEFLKNSLHGKSYTDDFPGLVKQVRQYNENVPPLVNAYMSLSSTMKSFGTSINETFGKVEETGIMVSIDDIYPQKTERHISSYIREKS